MGTVSGQDRWRRQWLAGFWGRGQGRHVAAASSDAGPRSLRAGSWRCWGVRTLCQAPGAGGQPHLQSIHADSSTLSPRRYCPNFLPCHQRTPLMMTSGSPSPTVEIHVYMQMSEFIYSQIHFKNRALNIQAQGRSVNAASGMSLGSHFSRRRWSP